MSIKLASWLRAAIHSRDGEFDGQGMVEYALILVLVALTALASIVVLRDSISVLLQQIDDVIIGALEGR